MITITTQKKGEIEAIQREFKNRLSADKILKLTAGAMNRAMKDGITKGINPEIKKNYNIPPKYMRGIAVVAPKARSNMLYCGIKLSYKTIPVVAFPDVTQTASGVQVSIRRGSTTMIPHAFIATRGSTSKYEKGKRRGQVRIGDDTHVFARGKYSKAGFVPSKERGSKGQSALSRLKTASPFTMGLSPAVSANVIKIINTEVLRGVRGALQGAVDKMTK